MPALIHWEFSHDSSSSDSELSSSFSSSAPDDFLPDHEDSTQLGYKDESGRQSCKLHVQHNLLQVAMHYAKHAFITSKY